MMASPRRAWFSSPARPSLSHQRELGISIVEVVVAMFILAVMSLALLPLLLGAIQASVVNRELVAATSLAQGKLAEVREAFPDLGDNSCAAVKSKAASNVPDPASSGLLANVTVGGCPSGYPGVVKVTAAAGRPGEANALAQLSTQVVVTKA